jgi:aminoglycoside/choline kinase family phosphotransferase
LSGDASTRTYERLHRTGGPPLILMDQPPVLETPICPPGATDAERLALGYNAAARLAAGSIAAFVTTAAYLRDHGLSAPRITAFNVDAGFAVLEDLGDGLFATLIAAGEPVFLFDENPTAERLAKMIYEYVEAQGFVVGQVEFWETKNCRATYRK